MKKFLKYLLYAIAIVAFSVISVLLRQSEWAAAGISLVLCIALVAVLSLISSKFKDDSQNQKKGIVKEEGRYYFYNDRCSFKLAKEDILQDDSERVGMKHSLMTQSMALVILEIRSRMPDFPSSVQTKSITVSGFPGLAAKTNPLVDEYSQYFIDCKDFVVQVSMSVVSEEFLNSFRLEK